MRRLLPGRPAAPPPTRPRRGRGRRSRRASARGGVSPGGVRSPACPVVGPPAAAGVEVGCDSRADGADLGDLPGAEASLADAFLQELVVLPLPAPVGRDDDVELEVLRVVSLGGAAERLLQVDVPAAELPLGAVPEDPDRVRVAPPLQHHQAVSLPAPAAAPPAG